MEVLVFGSAIVDFICYVPKLPSVGETLHARKLAQGFGGKGANQCVSAARLGAKCAMICKFGDDEWGRKYIEHLKEEAVNVEFVEQCKGEPTGIAQIAVADNGENHIIIVVGANNLLSVNDVTKATKLFDQSKVLICQQETPLKATLEALRNFKGLSILNAAPAIKDTPKELLTAPSIFCVNETEASLMLDGMEINDMKQAKIALQRFIALGVKTIIITLGPMGAVFCDKANQQTCIHVSAPKVEKPVDTTGAGDAFIGALAYSLARFPDLELHQHIGAACEVAAYSVLYPGTQSSFPCQKDIKIDPNTKKYKWEEL